MAISFYSGRPGAGKSYITVERVILPALKQGRTVVTNVPMADKAYEIGGQLEVFKRGKKDMKAIADMLLGDISEETGEYAPREEYAGAVFVIDEMSFLMPAGVKQSQIDDKVKAFFSMHRHISGGGYSTEIVVVSQDASQLNVYVKTMVERSYRIEKTMVGKLAIVNFTVYSGCVGYRSESGKAIQLKKETIKYKPEIFTYYKSQTMGDGLNNDETSTDDSTNLLKSPMLKMFLVAIVLFPFLGYFGIQSFLGVFGIGDPEPEPDPEPIAQVQSPVDQVSEVMPGGVPAIPPGIVPDVVSGGVEEELVIAKQRPVGDEFTDYAQAKRFWYVGSYKVSGQPERHVLAIKDGASIQRVYASELTELGIIVSKMPSGLIIMDMNGTKSIVDRLPNSKDVVKPFFANSQG